MDPLPSESGEEVIDLLARLVAFETESGAPNQALVDFCAERATQAGAHGRAVGGPSGRSNLHLRFGPDEPGGLLLSGHTDVVPAGSGWSTNPYRLTEKQGRLQGRGTADMKGFIAAALAVASSLDHRKLRKPLHLALSYDEEIGCIGVRGLLDHLAAQPACRPEAALVGEPTSMHLAIAHTGKTAHRVAIQCPAGHSSRARTEPSAISEAVKLGAAIDALNTGGGASAGEAFVSANIGSIDGGAGLNVLAPKCELAFEVRFDASAAVDALVAPIWGEIERINVELAPVGGSVHTAELADYPALHTDSTLPAVQKLGSAMGTDETTAVAFGCEAGLYAQRLGVPTVIAGPGDIADAHKPDEHIHPAQLQRCAEALHKAVNAFCFLP
ncbi:MAG: M20/M25/M40 family metallo-hydrolase [bacterium]|nr:M20/M25/M40 family metallo-hydrolase [bacterium]